MQHQNDRLAQFVAEAADGAHHVGGVVDVQVVGGLVQQDVFGVLRDDHGDQRTLALSARQLVDEAVLKTLQFHVGDGLVDEPFVLGGGAAAGVGEAPEGHQFPDGQLHLDVVGLGQDGQLFGQLAAFPAGNVFAAEVHEARVPGDEPRDDAHDGGLARPVGADQGEDLPLGDLKADGVHHRLAVVLLGQLLYAHVQTLLLVSSR